MNRFWLVAFVQCLELPWLNIVPSLMGIDPGLQTVLDDHRRLVLLVVILFCALLTVRAWCDRTSPGGSVSARDRD